MKKIMMIGAHPDDCDICCGGLALKYVQLGYKVKFLSLDNGCGGHQTMKPEEIAARRRKEVQEVAKMAGIEYDVWDDSADCELTASLEYRKRLVRDIRKFSPDLVITHRPNDYHVDHRNTSILVQDASYLLIVPNFCPDVPAMEKMPVIMYFYDHFQNPPFEADVNVDIDDVIEQKYQLLNCHVSQFYEWLPYTEGSFHTVPEDPAERFEWLHCPRVPRDGKPLDESVLRIPWTNEVCECAEAVETVKYRDLLVKRYGEKGRNTLFSEAFALCEYGTPLTEETEKIFFPF